MGLEVWNTDVRGCSRETHSKARGVLPISRGPSAPELETEALHAPPLHCHVVLVLGDVTELTWPGFLRTPYVTYSRGTAVLFRDNSLTQASGTHYIQTFTASKLAQGPSHASSSRKQCLNRHHHCAVCTPATGKLRSRGALCCYE